MHALAYPKLTEASCLLERRGTLDERPCWSLSLSSGSASFVGSGAVPFFCHFPAIDFTACESNSMTPHRAIITLGRQWSSTRTHCWKQQFWAGGIAYLWLTIDICAFSQQRKATTASLPTSFDLSCRLQVQPVSVQLVAQFSQRAPDL